MSLDITIKERKGFRCPDCGRLVMEQDIGLEMLVSEAAGNETGAEQLTLEV